MRRTVAVAAAVSALLAVPAGAQAKEIGRVLVCGPDGCRNVTSRLPGEAVFETGALGDAAPRGRPFVVVRVGIREPGHGIVAGWKFLFVPAAGMVRYEAEPGVFHWGRPAPENAAVLRRLARGVRPWPASRMPRDPRPAPAAATAPAAPAAAVPPAASTASGGGEGDGGPPVAAAVAAGALLAAGLGALGLLRRRRAGR
ncbi:MAG TPA: hypothetical protein VLB47_15305 [Solirubrobacteraceae bacterium]|nr:hypothetical protein [Solirubrobacteraceae bacterium]